jgi:hypothetical protein
MTRCPVTHHFNLFLEGFGYLKLKKCLSLELLHLMKKIVS